MNQMEGPRTTILSISLSEMEKKKIQEDAARDGRSVSNYIRWRLANTDNKADKTKNTNSDEAA